jgi:hypothetical protein
VSTFDINEAFRIYLGSNWSGGVTPYGMEARVHAKYGPLSSSVLEELNKVMDGLCEDSELLAVSDIAKFVTNRARLRRPDLKRDVCKAIGNLVSYSYR